MRDLIKENFKVSTIYFYLHIITFIIFKETNKREKGVFK